MKPLLNLDEPVQTVEGKPARVVSTDAKGKFPIIALVTNLVGELPIAVTNRGSFVDDSVTNHKDLINVPKKINHAMIYIRAFLMDDGTVQIRKCGSGNVIPTIPGAVGAVGTTLTPNRNHWV